MKTLKVIAATIFGCGTIVFVVLINIAIVVGGVYLAILVLRAIGLLK